MNKPAYWRCGELVELPEVGWVNKHCVFLSRLNRPCHLCAVYHSKDRTALPSLSPLSFSALSFCFLSPSLSLTSILLIDIPLPPFSLPFLPAPLRAFPVCLQEKRRGTEGEGGPHTRDHSQATRQERREREAWSFLRLSLSVSPTHAQSLSLSLTVRAKIFTSALEPLIAQPCVSVGQCILPIGQRKKLSQGKEKPLGRMRGTTAHYAGCQKSRSRGKREMRDAADKAAFAALPAARKLPVRVTPTERLSNQEPTDVRGPSKRRSRVLPSPGGHLAVWIIPRQPGAIRRVPNRSGASSPWRCVCP